MAGMILNRSLTVALLVAAVPGAAHAISIVSPAPGTRVTPGQSVTIVVAADADETLSAVGAGFNSRSIVDLQPSTSGRFEGT